MSCVTDIGITVSLPFNRSELAALRYDVVGSHSGPHIGSVSLSADGRTVIFKPTSLFDLGEDVRVVLAGRVLCGAQVTDSLWFSIERVHHDAPPQFKVILAPSSPNVPLVKIAIDKNPTPGVIFIASYGSPQFSDLMLINEHGNPIKNCGAQAMNFQKQPGGFWTYFDGNSNSFVALDSNFNNIRTYACVNGAATDLHELIFSPDRSYTMIGQIQTTKDMRQLVSGGDSASIITSNVIQRFDSTDALVFEWRGIDHYSVLDGNHENPSSATIDFEHANSLDLDSNGDYLLSNRNMSEISKLDGESGVVLWRFGGVHNQFEIQNDTLGFSQQHDVRWISRGDITLFDNGTYHGAGPIYPPPASRAVEYHLDERTMQASLVWQYGHEPPLYSSTMGSVQRLPNGNTFIGWGHNVVRGVDGHLQTVSATEVSSEDSVIFEMSLEADLAVFSYRAIKYPNGSPTSAVRSVPEHSGPQGEMLQLSVEQSSDEVKVCFSSRSADAVQIDLLDILGRRRCHLFNGISAGVQQTLNFPTHGLSDGVYYCTLTSEYGRVVRPIQVKN